MNSFIYPIHFLSYSLDLVVPSSIIIQPFLQLPTDQSLILITHSPTSFISHSLITHSSLTHLSITSISSLRTPQLTMASDEHSQGCQCAVCLQIPGVVALPHDSAANVSPVVAIVYACPVEAYSTLAVTHTPSAVLVVACQSPLLALACRDQYSYGDWGVEDCANSNSLPRRCTHADLHQSSCIFRWSRTNG
jgi:hypothetical protein